jgi:preprotein translocase subunit SecE
LAIRRDKPNRDDEDDRPDLQQPLREGVPGSLDHVSGEVEGFEAGLIRGAGGREADLDDGALEREALGAGAGRAPKPVAGPDRPTERGPARFLSFLRASWAELQRVQWPDRRQVGQGTAVTLGFVVVAGAYLGVADEIATRLVQLIL